MSNWKLLDDKTRELAWDFVYDNCCFHPYNSPKFDSRFKKVSVIKLPKPNVYYSTKKYFVAEDEECSPSEIKWFENFNSNLQNKLISIFKTLTKKKGERMYALDWQHQGYSFNPFLPFEKYGHPETWEIPAFPNGDYLFFLTKDFKNGIFGDGIHHSISFFGKEMVEQCKDLTNVFYKNDKPVLNV